MAGKSATAVTHVRREVDSTISKVAASMNEAPQIVDQAMGYTIDNLFEISVNKIVDNSVQLKFSQIGGECHGTSLGKPLVTLKADGTVDSGSAQKAFEFAVGKRFQDEEKSVAPSEYWDTHQKDFEKEVNCLVEAAREQESSVMERKDAF